MILPTAFMHEYQNLNSGNLLANGLNSEEKKYY